MSDHPEILAIPLWINGRAFLTMARAFFAVRDPRNGRVLRRTPLCGVDEAGAVIDSACQAVDHWQTVPRTERGQLLAALADALAGYDAHFAGLIDEESGKGEALATAEVADAVHLLRDTSAESGRAAADAGHPHVVAVVSDDQTPLLGLLRHAVPALLAGATVIIKPSPKAPSAAFAFAELTAQCGFPPGVFNLLQGDLAAIEGLCADDRLGELRFTGDRALSDQVARIAASCGRTFVT
ncbi:aldehyde dehydrogenase family protein [Accumulibacter sp.]|uniref:aldehyde dehydrogenase family protein n=1 Tax=Accumulibacter sp. TaxID=2053492 RepID=UPI0025E551F9|nr:aldehyde dehydrogenase family protein [Accumulibacter sp.]MCM8595311.1 aldehyde dehydrogenase family protein [Accumulibacter sp.]MCM8625266.1 aldehyde dehydrogenase family protein [Accumulibacter sp.]MDS4049458.1 aldehyde dehydrogenase family protein [Accumulibacter sp.]